MTWGVWLLAEQLRIKMYSFTIDTKDPHALSVFYGDLLGWERMDFGEDWACVFPPGTKQGAYPSMLFQRNPSYVPPVWPEEPGAQQQMAHLDLAVNDLERAVDHAIKCGARQAKDQFSDDCRVMLDPDGHPFCLCQMKDIMDGPDFALL